MMAQEAGLPARKAALAVLDTVLSGAHPLDGAVARERSLAALPDADRAFVRLMLSTCLRRLGEIDRLLDSRLKKPLARDAEMVRHILRLGTTQLVFLGTPPHAAVDTSVRLARSLGFGGFSGLVNAILRRLAGRSPLSGRDAAIANTPGWLWRSWSEAYGEDTAEAITLAHLSEPPLDITLKDDASITAETLEALVLPTGSLRRTNAGAPSALPGFESGDWWVQDAAAALPVRLLEPKPGMTVIDLCAAPGGKTAQLAAAGAVVTAVDRSKSRIAMLHENLTRLRLSAETVMADAAAWRPERAADAVLLDAPCTATGTIRRHPDIPHLKRPEDIARQAAIQASLIDASAAMVRPGGTLVYAVCSLQPEEGPTIVDDFLRRNGAFTRRPVRPGEIQGVDLFLTPAGDLHTLPSHWPELGGLDGFYAARITRAGS